LKVLEIDEMIFITECRENTAICVYLIVPISAFSCISLIALVDYEVGGFGMGSWFIQL